MVPSNKCSVVLCCLNILYLSSSAKGSDVKSISWQWPLAMAFYKKNDTNHLTDDGEREGITSLKRDLLSQPQEWLAVDRKVGQKKAGKFSGMTQLSYLHLGFLKGETVVCTERSGCWCFCFSKWQSSLRLKKIPYSQSKAVLYLAS